MIVWRGMWLTEGEMHGCFGRGCKRSPLIAVMLVIRSESGWRRGDQSWNNAKRERVMMLCCCRVLRSGELREVSPALAASTFPSQRAGSTNGQPARKVRFNAD